LYIVETYLLILSLLSKKNSSIRKLKQFIFGPKKEKDSPPNTAPKSKDNLSDNNDSTNSNENSKNSEKSNSPSGPENNDDSKKPENPKEEKKPRKGGNGRNSEKDYQASLVINCSLCKSEKAGEICPKCGNSTLYDSGETSQIKLIGSAPVFAVRFVQEISKCICGAIFKGKIPEKYNDLYNSPKYTPSALSSIIHSKYDIGVPFGSLSKFQQNCGVPLPASTQSNKINEHEDLFSKLFSHMMLTAANLDVFGMDDTSIKISEGNKKNLNKKQINAHGSVFVCHDLEKNNKVIIYDFSFDHAGIFLLKILSLRNKNLDSPICISDALPCYLPYIKESKAIKANCNSHARRKFFYDRNEDELCEKIISNYKIIYQNDKLCKQEKKDPKERQVYHEESSQEAMGNIFLICEYITSNPSEEKSLEIKKILKLAKHFYPSEPSSELYKNATYVLKNKESLSQFLRTPAVPLDTNYVENKIKAIIEIRKKGLFFYSVKSAILSAKILSLIETAQENGKNSWEYIEFVIKNKKEAIQNPEKFMPWNYDLHPKFNSSKLFSTIFET
jgi:hypothetical protein